MKSLRDFYTAWSKQHEHSDTPDKGILIATGFLLILGIIMVYSASITLPNTPRYARLPGNYFLLRHLIAVLISLTLAGCVFTITMKSWDKLAPYLFLMSLVLLLLVFIPGLGKEVNGAKRWLVLGPLQFQPSELAKLSVALYAANYVARKQAYMNSLKKGLLPLGTAVVVVGLLLLFEPDMGAFIVIAGIALGILFVGGINGKIFSTLVALGLATFSVLVFFSSWRRERIFAYLDPWREDYMLGKAYQLIHSLIAFGRGGWFGVGLGASIEKQNYLPEAHTDFILAVIGEELGFIFVLLIIMSLFFLVKRAFAIAATALQYEKTFEGLVAYGIGIWLAWQSFTNIGVNLGILPTKGLTLPFLSYGGSGIVSMSITIAILLRIDWENRKFTSLGRL